MMPIKATNLLYYRRLFKYLIYAERTKYLLFSELRSSPNPLKLGTKLNIDEIIINIGSWYYLNNTLRILREYPDITHIPIKSINRHLRSI